MAFNVKNFVGNGDVKVIAQSGAFQVTCNVGMSTITLQAGAMQ